MKYRREYVGKMKGEIAIKTNIKVFVLSAETRKFDTTSKAKRGTKLLMLVLAGVFIGGVNGLFGAGGGMLAVPALAIFAGLEERYAHATAILVMLPLCLISGAIYSVSNAVDFAVLIPTSIGVVTGGILGAKLLKFLPETALVFAFNFLVLFAGLKMLF